MASNFIDPKTTPVMIPPEGVIPNFEDPVSNAYISRDVTCTFLPLMFAFLALRIYSRAVITHNFGLDDILGRPDGRHLWDVPLSLETDSYLKTNFTFVLISAVSSMLVKVSLLALYLRIFNPVRIVNIPIYICTAVIMAFYLATIIAELVVGVPRPGGGGWTAAQQKYGPFGLLIYNVRGVFGILSDFTILIIPLTQIVKLHLPLKRKVVLVGVFLTGLFACISSILSCVFRFGSSKNEDYTWANTMPNTFAIIELTVGHMCGSMPTFPVLITALSKDQTLLSILHYLQSIRNRKGHGDAPTPGASESTPEQLPRIPNVRLTSLQSFMEKVRLISFSTKPTTDKSNAPSTYYDLESIDVDYHAHLRKDKTTNTITKQT